MKHRRILCLSFLLFYGMLISQNDQDTTFVNIRSLSSTILLDLKYATPDNFLHAKVYDCPDCYLRTVAAKALVSADSAFATRGYRIKLFDCYRPLDIQKRMWQLVTNADYVADPAKGSIHNRGLAVDITLVDSLGKELDMGTAFDHFGPESAYASKVVSRESRKNRRFLNRIMRRYGFKVLASEWWHYNYQYPTKPPVSNFRWRCD